MNRLVSIIVPVYNVELYIENCIKSIVQQTYRTLEIILIDDGSTDQSGYICECYAKKDNRIKVIHKQNGGISSARNSGLEICNGEYVFFVDSDDWIKPETIEKMVLECKTNNADMVICGICFDNQLRRNNFTYGKKCIYNNEELMFDYITENYINQVVWNKLYCSDLLKEVRFPMIKKNEDVCFTVSVLSKVNKAIYIDECLYVQNIRYGSMERSKFNETHLFKLQAIQYRDELIKQNYPMLMKYIEFDYIKAIISMLKIINSEGSYLQNRLIYENLCKELQQEIEKIKLDGKKVRTFRYPLDYDFLFRTQYMLLGILKKLKLIGKDILIRIKKYGY